LWWYNINIAIDKSLSFSSHISLITGKARSRCAVFFKNFLSRDKKNMILFFITYVRPLLESSGTVWYPVSSADNNKLENVFRFFTNRIRGCTFLPYHQRLSILMRSYGWDCYIVLVWSVFIVHCWLVTIQFVFLLTKTIFFLVQHFM